MAVKAPKVQSLAKISSSLNPAYKASKNVVNQQINALPEKYDAQRAAINAERGQGFNAINNQATGRGGSFSGVPVDEQATYLSTKYLPGMQTADYQENEEGLTLQGMLADINKEKRLQAMDIRRGQVSDLNSWRQMIQQQQFQAAEAAKERSFTAGQNAADRAASAAQSAAETPSLNSQLTAFLVQNSVKGKVNPAVWASAARMAHDNGINFDGKNGFASQYWQYADNKNWKKYLADRGGTNSNLKRYYKQG